MQPPALVQYHENGTVFSGNYTGRIWTPRRSKQETDSLFCRQTVLIEKFFSGNVMGKSSENGQIVKKT